MTNIEQMLRNQLGRIRQENIELSEQVDDLKVQKKKLQDEFHQLRANVKAARESRDKYKQQIKNLKESVQVAVSDAIKSVIKVTNNVRTK